jgi:cytochrome c-type biogenesis protein
MDTNGADREADGMTVVFAYLAGLLTLINPCVLPVLPIVLASSLNHDRRAPLALAAGMGLSFVALGVGVSALGPAVGLNADDVARAAALAMAAFGLILLVPALSARFSTATAGLAARADAGITTVSDRGLGGEFLGGMLLGATWSPCIGPTLGAAIALAATGNGLGQATLVMTGFAAGVATLILALAYGARTAIRRRQAALRALAARSRAIMGVAFLAIGTALWFGLHHAVEAWAVGALPVWLIDLSVSI